MGNNFSSNLKYLRLNRGMEQSDIANYLGLKSASSVSNWENGLNMPRAGHIADLANLFGVTMTDLIETKLEKQNKDNDLFNDVVKTLKLLNKDNLNKVNKFAKEKVIEQQQEEKLSNLDERTLRNLHRYAEKFGIDALDELFKEVLADTKSDDNVSNDNAG